MVVNDLKIPVDYNCFYPDIAIIAKGLFIDIEVDEPYSEEDGAPIHYLISGAGIEGSIDSERNSSVTKAGWEVIRFSEEQVVKQTQECINYIKEFIDSFAEGNLTVPYPQSNLIMKKWTEGKAGYMSIDHYRDSYNE